MSRIDESETRIDLRELLPLASGESSKLIQAANIALESKSDDYSAELMHLTESYCTIDDVEVDIDDADVQAKVITLTGTGGKGQASVTISVDRSDGQAEVTVTSYDDGDAPDDSEDDINIDNVSLGDAEM